MPEASPQETVPTVNPALESLRAGRQYLAEQAANNNVARAVSSVHHSLLKNVLNNSRPYDYGLVGVDEFLAFDALGIDISNVSRVMSQPLSPTREPIADINVGKDRLMVDRYSDEGMTVSLSPLDRANGTATEPEKSNLISELLDKRYERSPGHVAMARLRQDIIDSGNVPNEVTTGPFDPREDPLGTIVFLTDIGFRSSPYAEARQLMKGQKPADVLKGSLDKKPDYRIQRLDDDEATTYIWGDHVTKQLRVDNSTGNITYTVRKNQWAPYQEKANQSQAESLPFVETECAEGLVTVLDDAGLMLHPEIQYVMMNTAEADRYGSVYTQLTREIAKWINLPSRARVSNIFVPKNSKYAGEALAHAPAYYGVSTALNEYRDLTREAIDKGGEIELNVRQAFMEINALPLNGEAVSTLINMAQKALARPEDKTIDSDVPSTAERVEIRNGACFDVAAYYIGAAASERSDYLKQTRIGNVDFLEKNTGSHTFLSMEPMNFNGVRLPKGALFSKQEDGGMAFLRLTHFSFDKPEDQLAFGSEISKALVNERLNIMKIGGVSISHLVEAV